MTLVLPGSTLRGTILVLVLLSRAAHGVRSLRRPRSSARVEPLAFTLAAATCTRSPCSTRCSSHRMALSTSSGDQISEKEHRNAFLAPVAGVPESQRETGNSALIILNTIRGRPVLRQLWATAAVKLCADGGANRLHDSLDAWERDVYVPDIIKGDLDSLRPDVEEFYRNRGVTIIQDKDQDHNDFEKCLKEVIKIRDSKKGPQPDTVVALGAFGGRFDQEMQGFHILHQYTSQFDRLVLLDEQNLAFMLAPGTDHRILVDTRFEGPTCGLIPLGGPCTDVTTSGLRWNLQGGQLEFGVLISSSNNIEGDEVHVRTDAPLVWYVDLNTDKWMRLLRREQDKDVMLPDALSD